MGHRAAVLPLWRPPLAAGRLGRRETLAPASGGLRRHLHPVPAARPGAAAAGRRRSAVAAALCRPPPALSPAVDREVVARAALATTLQHIGIHSLEVKRVPAWESL